VPSQQLAALSASKDEDLKSVRLRHRRVLIHWSSFREICSITFGGRVYISKTRRLALCRSCDVLPAIAPAAGRLPVCER
jgi:hypothetical protein